MSMSANKLILGDNLDILRAMDSETIDLIYLDPPFFSNRNYEVIWGDDGEVRSFQDRWAGGIEHYIAWLNERVIEMHRILKPSGSIFLHCDWHANAYIRVEILDRIFGMNNFRNEIIWHYPGREMHNNKKLNAKYDVIYFYARSEKTVINMANIAVPYDKDERLKGLRRKVHKDEDGQEWVWETRGQAKGQKPYKRYLDEIISQGKAMNNVWTDIPILRGNHPERIGYPTQKPEALLQRIINMASNEGDTVLDPFMGGGTTIIVADKLNRKWIGIDQSVAAVKVSDLRLKNRQDMYSSPYELQLSIYNYNLLRNQNAFEFETFIIEQFGGIANPKQRNDFGLDGRMPDNTPIQVKRSDNIGRNVIDNFKSAIERSDKKLFEKNRAEGKVAGYIIAFSFGKGAVEETARLKNKEHIIIELKKVSDIVSYGKPPKVTLTASELEHLKYAFEATAESETGIEHYSWDFNHRPEEGFKADVYLDREGKQVRKLQPGEHQIAVEAVDKSGLDGMDKIKLKIDGNTPTE